MTIDDNPKECEAMALFKQGNTAEAARLQETFLEDVKASGADHCSCPAACSLHGKCMECVVVHRGHGDHLPHCMHTMLNRKIEQLSALSEHSFTATPKKP